MQKLLKRQLHLLKLHNINNALIIIQLFNPLRFVMNILLNSFWY